VAAVARRLGIAPATLRTWDRRYGLGPTGHTTGSHRRYSARDVSRLDHMREALLRGAAPAEAARYAAGTGPAGTGPAGTGPAGSPAAAAAAAAPDRVSPAAGEPPGGRAGARSSRGNQVLRLPGAGDAARGLGRAALAMDAIAARRLVDVGIRADGIIATWDDVVRPVLRAIGLRWAETGAGVEIEHLLSAVVAATLDSAPGHPDTHPDPDPGARHRPVLLACVPGEQHSLPLHALAAVLSARAVPVRMLGADLPVDALAAAVRRTAPIAVVLWAQLTRYADPALPGALPRTRPGWRTCVGGPGWERVGLPRSVEVLHDLRGAADRIAAIAGLPGAAAGHDFGVVARAEITAGD
jgi:hypothetical protein